MATYQLTKPLVLIGLMGCGKSAIGTRIAKKLNLDFIDSDKAIEEKEGMSVSDIFASKGEHHFRQMEEETILELLQKEPFILATGGGAFMNQVIRNAISTHAISVWLDAPLEILLERTSRNNERPLLAGEDKEQILKDLIEKRYPVYSEANVKVVTSEQSHEATIELIENELERYINDSK